MLQGIPWKVDSYSTGQQILCSYRSTFTNACYWTLF